MTQVTGARPMQFAQATTGVHGDPPGQPPGFDPTTFQQFSLRLLDDMAGALAVMLGALGDRLGLFEALALQPATTAELATRTGCAERPVREWCAALASRGYLQYEADSQRFSMPPAHALALAAGGPLSLAGGLQLSAGLAQAVEAVAKGYRSGRPMPQHAFGEDLWRGMERMSAGWLENELVPRWLAALPGLQDLLARGARVAELGCGRGRALIVLARAFPHSTFTGYDRFPEAVEAARRAVREEGLDDRIRIEVTDVLDGIPGHHDAVLAFDALHDMANPGTVLRLAYDSLPPGGWLLLLETRGVDRLEDALDRRSTILLGTSALYNVLVSVTADGSSPGLMGLSLTRLRAMLENSGFTAAQEIPVANPFHVLLAATRPEAAPFSAVPGWPEGDRP